MLSQVVAGFSIPLGRAGTPQEAADLIAFLVSPAVSYLTGIQLTVEKGGEPQADVEDPLEAAQQYAADQCRHHQHDQELDQGETAGGGAAVRHRRGCPNRTHRDR